MNVIVGIDVGQTGAIGFLDAATGDLLGVEDMPADKVEGPKGSTRLRVSDIRLLVLLRGLQGHAFIERPEGRPIAFRDKKDGSRQTRQPGAAGMLSLGESFGIARCACTAAGLALTEVRPGKWKGALGVGAEKDESRRRATEMWPGWQAMFTRKMDHDRAEAALIGHYGYLQIRRTISP
jgi:hypothetical protein